MGTTPVLVVGGFLGSGKTTLVRRLLEDAQATGRKLAVVSNEFGELGIDAALLGAGEARMVELAGGCVCCQLSDELVDTLSDLHDSVHPDAIVIECSGLALPFDTQLHLYRAPVRDWLGDEACVVVVDAERWDEADDLFSEQVQSADLVILSKIDLVDEPTLASARARLAELAPDAPVIEAVYGNVPVDILFPAGPSAGGRRGERITSGSGRETDASSADADHNHDHDHDHVADATHRHAAWSSRELRVPAGLTEEAAEALLRAESAVRIKGFVRLDVGVRVAQGVGRRLEFAEPQASVEPALLGRVVVIGRSIA
jgi:G3E family GTPase